ncbi:hypothetical protein BOW53_08920 [Solemya pervernicosa gill symbiont]|uniref:Crp/Fnr family transcriptional regulator n=2 Tax=Gammaproteobacteria incertae sedis TaxID=118884 RepID=A0A1T2L4X4_9GAMM|nr:hypothetical protein [Candidatus Reidiella endopervernicosa]OOZ40139.1 hypothetical protein BOW53_08920 [Solemya pervernicosa gill symbiont]QKQ27449.1 Crp/Fnr family transcriptional regulator [Candidatus Reidiella endopervernicosa]
MGKKKAEKRLSEIVKALPENHLATLLEFAEYMFQRHGVEVKPEVVMEPVSIPRPEEESVIAAIKRLSATYPMVDKAEMLNKTSSLVMQHMLQGRDAVEVIDEIEQVFEEHYQLLLNATEDDD